MKNGRLTIWIDGREALPVRAIPYVTGWQYSPDVVAESLAGVTAAPFAKLQNLVAYHRPATRPQQIMRREWNAVVAEIKGFETELHEQRPGISAEDDHVGYAAWCKGATAKLPVGVFVWLDEFVSEHQADRKRTLAPDDRPVILAPLLNSASRDVVLEGFEDCPRRPPQADQAMIGYSEFVTICHVDNPKNFGNFRLEADGLYVVRPDADAILTPEERAAITWHPTGNHDKPALSLPCTLGQLRAFLPDAGMLGCIDEDEVDAVLADDGSAEKCVMTYKNISKCLDGYWEKPWHELPAEQRQAWREALAINFDEQDAGRRWDGYTLKQRRGVAESYDAGHDPAREGERRIAWFDVTLNAAVWWKRASVKPDEAAMLLCRLDPLKGEDPALIFVDGDESSPARYRVLLRVFNDVAETSPQARTLLDWLCVAQREGLRYHSWIDEYALAMPVVPQGAGAGGTEKKDQAPVVEDGNGSAPFLEHWKMQVQAEAAKRWREQRNLGCNPNPHSLKDELAKWCREENIFTKGNINPNPDYLYRHVLSKRHWTPPTD